jgi:hypothetical protein
MRRSRRVRDGDAIAVAAAGKSAAIEGGGLRRERENRDAVDHPPTRQGPPGEAAHRAQAG